MPDLGNLSDAYRDGRESEVWEFIHQHDATILRGEHAAEVRDVVRECARRVRHNTELIVERLESIEFRWRGAIEAEKNPESAKTYPALYRPSPWGPDHPDLEARLEVVEATLANTDEVGTAIPLLVRALLETGPSVDLAGTAPHWDPPTYVVSDGRGAPDAAAVDPLQLPELILFEQDVGRIHEFGRLEGGTWVDAIDVACTYGPDPIMSAGYSGGDILMWWPQPQVDAVLSMRRIEPNRTPTALDGDDRWLTDYLNEHFEWGGFPGFAFVPDAPMDDIEMLRNGLLRV